MIQSDLNPPETLSSIIKGDDNLQRKKIGLWGYFGPFRGIFLMSGSSSSGSSASGSDSDSDYASVSSSSSFEAGKVREIGFTIFFFIFFSESLSSRE